LLVEREAPGRKAWHSSTHREKTTSEFTRGVRCGASERDLRLRLKSSASNPLRSVRSGSRYRHQGREAANQAVEQRRRATPHSTVLAMGIAWRGYWDGPGLDKSVGRGINLRLVFPGEAEAPSGPDGHGRRCRKSVGQAEMHLAGKLRQTCNDLSLERKASRRACRTTSSRASRTPARRRTSPTRNVIFPAGRRHEPRLPLSSHPRTSTSRMTMKRSNNIGGDTMTSRRRLRDDDGARLSHERRRTSWTGTDRRRCGHSNVIPCP